MDDAGLKLKSGLGKRTRFVLLLLLRDSQKSYLVATGGNVEAIILQKVGKVWGLKFVSSLSTKLILVE